MTEPRFVPPALCIDPFADVRRGRSIFEMRPQNWIEPTDPPSWPSDVTVDKPQRRPAADLRWPFHA